MYIGLLKKIYYQERSKLESIWIHKQEMKLRVVQFHKRMIEKLENCMNVNEISGRDDMADAVKENLLSDADKGDRLQARLDLNIAEERKNIEKEAEDEARNANYNPEEYADYLFQAEKVYAIESELAEKGFYPEQVYFEQGLENKNKESV
jgi:single-stranded DNA-specific DHH superfamily exonuclease